MVKNQHDKEDVIAIIPAAGQGLRFGGLRTKLLEPVAGKAVITHTIERLRSVPEIGHIIIACRPEDEKELRSLLSVYSGMTFVEGGATRSASVRNALSYAAVNLLQAPENQLIAVHDGARCCVSAELVQKTIRAAREHKAVSVGMPLSDSIKEVNESGRVVCSKPREGLWTIQTPQVFLFSILWEAHQVGAEACTDDSGLVESLYPVYMVEGERQNIKITTQEDLKLAALYLACAPARGA